MSFSRDAVWGHTAFNRVKRSDHEEPNGGKSHGGARKTQGGRALNAQQPEAKQKAENMKHEGGQEKSQAVAEGADGGGHFMTVRKAMKKGEGSNEEHGNAEFEASRGGNKKA